MTGTPAAQLRGPVR